LTIYVYIWYIHGEIIPLLAGDNKAYSKGDDDIIMGIVNEDILFGNGEEDLLWRGNIEMIK
jgi:hypothetical protein